MAEIKFAIGSKEEKKVFKHVVSGADSEKLFGKKIGEKFRGEVIGLNGYELEITGGSDSTGFPMRADVAGPGRKKIIITRSLGFGSKRAGQRKRRSIRGNTVSADTAQINCKVVKAGKDKIAKILGAEAKPAEGEAPKEAELPKEEAAPVKEEVPKEEPKQEAPAEEPKEEPKEEKKEEPVVEEKSEAQSEEKK
ncbi:30S ribosomal protein S6e [Candidatus Woesearchaeota archaeon]|jgi:small subunit ribosomal protein S6e|nr:30S ribosomal protein S6e [Candidatus Woesearchaeota archaeon]MBT4114683.1 30S ribosomal protein S6e [Candidatus Woesearchaeota archaeon]MBT4248328.1 30S ribosomal protein S6e [Candidatus Woesearchaeota archaeon]